MEKIPEEQSISSTDETQLGAQPALPQRVQLPGETLAEWNCPKCTGPMIKCQVGHVAIYGWWLERVVRQAGALGPPRTVSSEVAARVCIRCGYTELYAKEPGALLSSDDPN